MTNNSGARILVVEDNADLAFGLQTALEIDGYDVEVAEDGRRGLERLRQSEPDLLILDLMLPAMDGYSVLRAARGEGMTMPVLILTARGEEADKVLGLDCGADDYVTKPFGTLELLARVRAQLRRSQLGPAEDDVLKEQFGDIEVDGAAHTVTRAGTLVSLTPKEFDLLVALVRRRGAAATREDLLKEVWQYEDGVMTRTVDIHIAELRRKLETNPARPQHILTVRKVGYRLKT
ncbi:MAG: response regulator transcription factor [Gemmatimonadales bacterium]